MERTGLLDELERRKRAALAPREKSAAMPVLNHYTVIVTPPGERLPRFTFKSTGYSLGEVTARFEAKGFEVRSIKQRKT